MTNSCDTVWCGDKFECFTFGSEAGQSRLYLNGREYLPPHQNMYGPSHEVPPSTLTSIRARGLVINPSVSKMGAARWLRNNGHTEVADKLDPPLPIPFHQRAYRYSWDSTTRFFPSGAMCYGVRDSSWGQTTLGEDFYDDDPSARLSDSEARALWEVPSNPNYHPEVNDINTVDASMDDSECDESTRTQVESDSEWSHDGSILHTGTAPKPVSVEDSMEHFNSFLKNIAKDETVSDSEWSKLTQNEKDSAIGDAIDSDRAGFDSITTPPAPQPSIKGEIRYVSSKKRTLLDRMVEEVAESEENLSITLVYDYSGVVVEISKE